MKVFKKTSVSGQWAKKGEDFKDGDIVKVLNSGEIVSGEYGERQVFKIETRNGERLQSFNQTSLNNMIDAYGDETEGWVGRDVKVFMVRAMVSGKLQNVVYFAPPGWIMTDEGAFLSPKMHNQPTIDIPEIKTEDLF